LKSIVYDRDASTSCSRTKVAGQQLSIINGSVNVTYQYLLNILCCGGGRFYVVEEGEVNTLITRFDIQRKSHEEINAAKFAKFYFLSIINFIPPRENA